LESALRVVVGGPARGACPSFGEGCSQQGFGLTIVNDVASAHGWDLALADGDDGGLRVEFTGVEA
jgi:uncharacterized protein (DUF983 family)